MIGIPALDAMSTWELILITWEQMYIRIPEPEKESQLTIGVHVLEQPQIREMSQQKIITLCKMEIESRFGLDYVRQKIDSHTKEGE